MKLYLPSLDKVEINVKEFQPYLTDDEICDTIKKIHWDNYFNIIAYCYPVTCFHVAFKDKGFAWAEKEIVVVHFPISSRIDYGNPKRLEIAMDIIEHELNEKACEKNELRKEEEDYYDFGDFIDDPYDYENWGDWQ